MSFAEKLIKDRATDTPAHYASRVRWSAVIYFVLNLVSLFIVVIIVWRSKFFVTLAQRSNIETLTLALVMILALYYLFSTSRGFIGALRILQLRIGNASEVEARKQAALKKGSEAKFACFDKVIRLKGKPDEPVDWEVGDDAGKLGHLTIVGARVTYRPIKDGMKDSVFEFLGDQLEKVLLKYDPDASVNVTEWSTIDEDQASAYDSMVTAFQNLEREIKSKGPLWPTYYLTQADVDEVQQAIRELVPHLRNEALLPDSEYEVEYSVPIIPEPLAFIRLSRRDNRADPMLTMGCAGLVMLGLLLILTMMVILPPWVPGS